MKKFLKKIIPQPLKDLLRGFLSNSDSQIKNFNPVYLYPENWSGKDQKFYAQYGEDLKILPLFKDKKNGYFIEIGAMEGVRFSNTFLFEKMGWKGICVEPHPDYVNLLKENRPGSKIIAAAVGREDNGSVDFYTNFRGSLSTLDKELEGYFKNHYGKWFGGFKAIKVPLMSLNTIIQKYQVPNNFDLLSIDTEGTEADVFEGFSIQKYSPRIVIAEISIKREPVEAYMKKCGYTLACSNPSNAIFCRDQADADIIRYTNIIGRQEETKHPLD